MGKQKRKVGTLTKILAFVAFFSIVFIATMCWFFYKFQSVPEPLVYSVLGATGGELGIMGWIETIKKKYEK